MLALHTSRKGLHTRLAPLHRSPHPAPALPPAFSMKLLFRLSLLSAFFAVLLPLPAGGGAGREALEVHGAAADVDAVCAACVGVVAWQVRDPAGVAGRVLGRESLEMAAAL